MSLHVYLSDPTATYEAKLYSANITHNLTKMAEEAGIYKAIWRPEEIGAKRAKDIIEPLQKGFEELILRPDHFRTFAPQNGWGSYESLVRFTQNYLSALMEYPEAKIEVWR